MAVLKDSGKDFVLLSDIGNFSPEKTFDCGQCFRFTVSDGKVSGIAHNRHVTLTKKGDTLLIDGISDREYASLWESYLSLDTDYTHIDSTLTEALPTEAHRRIMRSAARVSAGIRILRQDRWETLCSFIISQNNNIPRIKKIIESLCRTFGEPVAEGAYAFPSPEALLRAGEDALRSHGAGFRAPYIIDAARRVAEDGDFLSSVAAAADYEEADSILRSVKGVGPKVSACTLLFGFGRTDAFPVDVWIRRVMDKYFPEGLDYTLFGEFAGIAQQYLFYYERYAGGNV